MTNADGYHRLAAIMGSYPSLAICRRFMRLNAYNVLSLQSELAHLEEGLTDIVIKDRDSEDPGKATFEFSIFDLKDACEDPDNGLQWRTLLEVRAKLKEYYEACTRFQHLASCSAANASDLSTLRSWFEEETGGHFSLQGIESYPWRHEEYTKDLTSLTARDKDQDTLSRWIDTFVMRVYHNTFGYRWKDPIVLAECANLPQPLYDYSDAGILRAVNALSTILSSLLPTVSIFVLYFIHNPLARMGAIVGFTFLFAAVLTLVAKARRIDCFAATTAFAAVQVVFVSVGNP